MNRVLSISLLIIALVHASHAQKTESTLVDKFQNATCEELWARLDAFLFQLNSDSQAVGTVALSGKTGELRDDLWIEDMIRRYFMRRNVAPGRWNLLRMRPETERNVEFWITPAGAKAPKIKTADWLLVYPKETKPFLFSYDPDHMEEVSVCLASNRLRLLAQVLEANPTARTNVVLIVRSQNEFVRRRRQTISELVSDYGIQRRQIKIFKQMTYRRDPHHIEPDVEYWLVP